MPFSKIRGSVRPYGSCRILKEKRMAKKKKVAAPKGAKSTKVGLFAPAALKLAASASKVVTFSCSSALCLVSIQLGLQKATFVSTGQMLLPPGFHQLTV